MEGRRDEILCTRCGAPLPASAATAAATCEFCGTTSAPAQPKVVERVVERVVVVAASGAPAARVGAGARLCPRCREPLFETTAHEVTLAGCGACGGIWLDNAGSRAITQRTDDVVLGLVERASAHAVARVDTRAAGIPCAQCGQPMQRTRAPYCEVDLDLCEAHGTWFDRDELTRVSRAFAAARVPRAHATVLTAQDLADIERMKSSGADLENASVASGVTAALGVLGAFLAVAAAGSRGS